MKICMLTTSFPGFEGDFSGIFVHMLALELVKGGNEVEVVAMHNPGTKICEVIDSVRVHRCRYMFPSKYERLQSGGGIPTAFRESIFAKLQVVPFLLSLFLKSLSICRGCDVIHAHWTLSGLVGVLVAKILEKPVVVTVHGSDINYGVESPLGRVFNTFVLRRANRIIAVSSDLANKIRLWRIPSDKVRIIPNGVDIDDFSVRHEEGNGTTLLWVGRMTAEKGLDNLLRAMPAILQRIPAARLTLVGDGPLMKSVVALARHLGVHDSVVFEGRKPYHQVPEYMRRADLIVLPSLSEGFGMSLIEAMGAGKATVATNVGGIPDIVVDGCTGILVPPGDPGKLAEVTINLLEDETLRQRMGVAGRKRVRDRFAWRRIAEETMGVYRSLLNESAGKS